MLKFDQSKGLNALAALLSNLSLLNSMVATGEVENETIELLPLPPEEVTISPELVASGYGKQEKRKLSEVIDDMTEIEYHELLISDASGLIEAGE